MSSSSSTRRGSYCRKDKSLALLSSKFVEFYDNEDVKVIHLYKAAKHLGVKRRRIYDIVNVLESIGMVEKGRRTEFSMVGLSGVQKALEALREEALRETCCCEENNPSIEDSQNDKAGDGSSNPTGSANKSDNRSQNFLGQLTQKFVKMFLMSDVDIISLEEAARLLLPEGNNTAKKRRIYDIANILSSINLIEKIQITETKKPAIRWLGLIKLKHLRKREFATDITNADSKRNKSIFSEFNKPRKYLREEHDCNQIVGKKLWKSEDFVFGPFAPVKCGEGSKENRAKKQ